MSTKPNKGRLLLQNGVGKKYHGMSLTDYPNTQAPVLLEWLENDASKDLSLGKGLLFFGLTQEGYDLTVLTARALILTGLEKLQCLSFVDVADHEVINNLWVEKPPLIITNFTAEPTVVDPERYKRLENLLNYYLDNYIPFFLHFPVDFNGPQLEYGLMISPVFLDRLLKNHKVISLT